jgi:leucyl-tRNA---protein transferase
MFRSFINEAFYSQKVSSQEIDALLANGWRHFGTHFFRYNLGIYDGEIRLVIPLRIRLSNFALTKSQRRILRRNKDLQTIIRPIEFSQEKEILFDCHKRRFKEGVPDSIYDFLDENAANTPCKGMEISVYDANKLLAASFFDVGATAVSGVYGMFAPEAARRSLGIFTMLLEIDFAIKSGKNFYYQCYCYEGNSYYDYKKQFRGTEKFDWQGNWEKFEVK